MKKFLKNLLKFSSFGIFVLIILMICYYLLDPFKVIRSYHDYSSSYIIGNRDYISTEMFIKKKKKYKYDSFIFGDSRTVAFSPKTWSNYLPENSSPFLFDASGESIYGIYKKLKYLDSLNIKLNNVLIILSRDCTFDTYDNYSSHLFIKDPRTSGESKLVFHLSFIKSYLDPTFLFNYYNYTITKEFKPYMSNYIEQRKIIYDTITNESFLLDVENEINKNPKAYYNKRTDEFYSRKNESIDSIQRIGTKQYDMLKYIKDILVKNKTNFKIVICPLYDQIKFNSADISKLKYLFDANLYDFSGKNSFTDPVSNYYETIHFRPLVGDSIFKIIYNKFY